MKLLRQIELRHKGCSSRHRDGEELQPFVHIYAKMTAGCNARCPFCCNAGQPPEGPAWDADLLFHIISELESSGIRVTKLKVTGGEPALVPNRVERILKHLDEPQFLHIHTQLNTNGLLPASQQLMRSNRWDYISVSLHHYDLRRLSLLYGTDIGAEALHFSGINRRRMNVSCNLIRGYVDSPAEARRMISFTQRLDIPRLGFVALLPMNDWCRSHFVPLSAIGLEQMDDVRPTFHQWDEDRCECRNFLTGTADHPLSIYVRYKSDPSYCPSMLSFDGQHLHQGFGNDNIII